jgi:hypothetical protein
LILFGAIHRAIYLIGILNIFKHFTEKIPDFEYLQKEMSSLLNIKEFLEEQVYPSIHTYVNR